jgi:hypothetical protein
MQSPIDAFREALAQEELAFHAPLLADNMGAVLRSAINEFDLSHYSIRTLIEPSREQLEQHYIMRLGMTRLIRLAFELRSSYDAPIVMFRRSRESALYTLSIVSALGMLEHGRRVLQSTKTGMCRLSQADATTFEFVLPDFIPDAGHHEKAMADYYREQEAELFERQLARRTSASMTKTLDELFRDLVYPFRDHFIGYGADPILDSYFFAVASHRLSAEEGYDTFNYATKFGGVRFQKYVLATTFFLAIALRHKRFCEALVTKEPRVRLENILTISSDRGEFRQSIIDALDHFGSGYVGFERTTIDEAEAILRVLCVSRENAAMLDRPVAPLPYLIQPSETGLIKLLAGPQLAPMQFLLHSLRHHFPTDYDRNQQQREGVLQRAIIKELTSAFTHLKFAKNIKLRDKGKELTDLDLVIMDKKTGTVILCQLKYQDLFGSDIISEHSRVTRLGRETDKWLKAVSLWQETTGMPGLRATLRLPSEFQVSKVLKLVLSKHYAYPLGSVMTGDDEAFCNWLQLLNALALMKRDQGSFRTVRGLFGMLQKQNREPKLKSHLPEPPTTYTIGKLAFSIRQESDVPGII